MFLAQFNELLSYPESRWRDPASNRWVSLCTGMRAHEAPCRGLIINKERKWELVSAVQKSIRRGDKQVALRLISVMDSMPEEYAYFWRRLCVIACEDVGPADDTLSAFVVACSTIFPPRLMHAGVMQGRSMPPCGVNVGNSPAREDRFLFPG
jgi:hypothetical protein